MTAEAIVVGVRSPPIDRSLERTLSPFTNNDESSRAAPPIDILDPNEANARTDSELPRFNKELHEGTEADSDTPSGPIMDTDDPHMACSAMEQPEPNLPDPPTDRPAATIASVDADTAPSNHEVPTA